MGIEANYNDGGLTSAAPFYNDWDETKKYLQMLFTPGRALQARELTQLQTMLQTQIDRFGSHVFENGSPVAGGLTTVHTDVSYVRIDPDASYENISDYSTLVGETITDAASGVQARVVSVDSTVTDDDPYPVLFIHYTAASPDGGTTTFTNDSQLSTATVSVLSSSSSSGGSQVQVISSAQESALGEADEGKAYLVSIDQGIFFVDGFFIVVDAQTTALSTLSGGNVRQYSSRPTARVGLTTTKSVVDIGTDSTLGDPANGSANFSAPGAQRLKFVGTLEAKSYTETTSSVSNASATDFIELIRIVSGQIRKQIKYPVYADLIRTLERRTYDESGNYTVKAFRANVKNSRYRRVLSIPTLDTGTDYTVGEVVQATTGSSSSSSGGAAAIGFVANWNSTDSELTVDLFQNDEFVVGDYIVGDDSGTAGYCTEISTEHIDIVLDPGKAYVFGQEMETIAPTTVTIPKARELDSAAASTTDCFYGNYFICDSIDGVFDINEQESLTLLAADTYSSSSSSGATGDIGSAKVKHMLWDSVNDYYRVYVYDVSINNSELLANVEKIVGDSTGTIAYIDDTNGKVSGSTKLYEKSENASIFRLPNRPVQGTLSSPVYYYRVYQSGGTVSGGAVSFTVPSTSTGDLYHPTAGGTTTSNLRQNYILVNDTDGTDISADITQANRVGDTVTLSGLASHNGDSVSVIAVLQSSTIARTKSLVSDYQIPLTLTANASNEIDLGIADVISVSSVLDIADSNADVTSKFILDNGQRDNIYDYAKLKLAPGETVDGSSGYTVTVSYYTHSGVGPLTFNSYSGLSLDFDSYPVYNSPNTGQGFNLRDCVDFRPIKDNQYVGSSSSSSSPQTIDVAQVACPYDSEYRTFTATHNFYKARIDKIVLRRDMRFDSIQGVPALIPDPPADDPKAMTLYDVFVPPYSENLADVELRYVDNRRYTMRDIGKLRNRIANVEYYASLSLLEQNADTLTIRDANGAERFKNGILVDAFNGHQVGDVYNRGYACSMDFTEGHLRPPFLSDNLSLDYNSGGSTNVSQNGDLVTLTPTSTTQPFVEQPLASRCLSVNPFNITSWLGYLKLTPESDTWMDTTTRPNVQVNYEGSADAWAYINNGATPMDGGYSTEWNDWETYWSGTVTQGRSTNVQNVYTLYNTTQSSRSSTTEAQIKQTRSGIRTYYDVSTVEEDLGERVVNMKIIPYMRAKTVTATATGMKPNTILYPYFGDTDVSQYCTPTQIKTDQAGDVTVTFNLPGGEFEAGTKLFRLTDEPNNIYAATTTAAEAHYTSRGMLEEKVKDIVSTKTVVTRKESVDDFRTLVGARVTNSKTSSSVNGGTTGSYSSGSVGSIQSNAKGWADPLAQSFLVDAANFPNGVMLSSVDLFFRTKDESLPVTIDLRPSVNGYPSSNYIIPLSTVTKKPSEVNTTEIPDPTDSDTYTRFEFPSYVYLAPGEYHVTVRSNSDEYCAFIAEIGQTQISTGERITEQPYAGVLFKSQNASTWTADQYSDLTFRLNRCVFDTTASGTAVFRTAGGGSGRHFDVVQILSEDIAFSDAPIEYTYDTTVDGGSPSGTFSPARVNTNLFQNQKKQADNLGDFVLKSTLSTFDAAISPILDEERLSVIIVENIINDSTTNETEPEADLVAGAKARYMTRRVTLRDGSEATDLRVFCAASIPSPANIYVYYKVLAAEDDTPFDDRPWVQLTEVNGLKKQRFENEFLEYEFRPTTTDDNGDTTVVYNDYSDFQTYAIKVVMTSTNSSKPPVVKDFRTIAVL